MRDQGQPLPIFSVEGYGKRDGILSTAGPLCDVVSGDSTLADTKARVRLLKDVFWSGKFPLKKWVTSSRALGEYIRSLVNSPHAQVSFEEKDFFLGTLWNRVEDTIGVSTTKAVECLNPGEATEKNLLKALSQIFDPIEIISAVSISSKIII